jgi:hypothetical protein
LSGPNVSKGIFEADTAVAKAKIDNARLVDVVAYAVKRLKQADQL